MSDTIPEWLWRERAETAEKELREARAENERARKLLSEYADPERQGAWHSEECFCEASDWLFEQWLETADEMPESASWQERKAAADAWAATQPAPTDEQLCGDGCPYPRARAFLARLVPGDPK